MKATKAMSIGAAALLTSIAARGQCLPHEYSQYKDRAKTTAGQMALAQDGCRAMSEYYDAMNDVTNALGRGSLSGDKDASAKMRACLAEKVKIEDSLKAANAAKALRYIKEKCPTPIRP